MFGNLVDQVLVPANLIFNIQGEQGDSYEPGTGRIRFLRASGSIYTPDRVDSLFIPLIGGEDPNPLAVLIPGIADPANADTGCLTTLAVIPKFCNGLPWNFGPGVGQWARKTGRQSRLRLTFELLPNAGQAPTGQGSIQYQSVAAPGQTDVSAAIRNYFGVAIQEILLIVECVHSVQG